ncbi:hypothetical protein ACF0H5_016467 [Mactra antiquata]
MIRLLSFCLFCVHVVSVTSTFSDINNAILDIFNDNIKHNNSTAEEYVAHLFEKVVHHDVDATADVDGVCSNGYNTTACKQFLTENCLDVQGLLTESSSSPGSSIVDWFPSLVYYMYSPACIGEVHFEEEHVHIKVASGKVWGYGLGFVAIICCVANVGGLMTPFMKHRFFQRLLLFCVALAVGTLGATGMLVLIPESMDLTHEGSPVPDYHYKMTTVMGGIYFFYVTERLLKFWFYRNKNKDKTYKITSDKEQEISANSGTQEISVNSGPILEVPDEMKQMMEDESKQDTTKASKKISTVALMILIGDALHNFVDGIAIGAAFTENTYLGISVSLSVICEELPHELGDIAILLHSGLSMKRSLCYNFLAALTIVIGLVIGIILGENTDANMWIFAVAGGIFLYIALVDMLPEMADQARHVEETGLESKWTAFIIQNLGLVTGFMIILILVLYGDISV